MNDALIANICTMLSTMKADQKWTPDHDEAFLVGLEDLPDEAGLVLRREILKQFDWRPSVKDVRDLWRKISSPAPQAADELVSRLLSLRDKYGEFVVPHPDFPGLLESGEPRWTDPMLRRLAAARGGWVNFCREESNSTQAAQLLNLAKMIIGGAGDADIDALRLEYQSAQQIESPKKELPKKSRSPHLEQLLEPPRFAVAEDEKESVANGAGLIRLGSLGLRGMK